jgi:hypothetical protein
VVFVPALPGRGPRPSPRRFFRPLCGRGSQRCLRGPLMASAHPMIDDRGAASADSAPRWGRRRPALWDAGRRGSAFATPLLSWAAPAGSGTRGSLGVAALVDMAPLSELETSLTGGRSRPRPLLSASPGRDRDLVAKPALRWQIFTARSAVADVADTVVARAKKGGTRCDRGRSPPGTRPPHASG